MDHIDPASARNDGAAGPTDVDASEGADAAIVASVVAGDETAFLSLIDHWSPMLTALATRVAAAPLADALVTGTWGRALDMLRAFREPPGLRVLLVRALLDEARAAGLLVATAAAFQRVGVGPTVDAGRFRHPDDPEWPGHWARPPELWPISGTDRIRLAPAADEALESLPEPQRLVVAMRDCGGCQVEQISRIIGVSPGQVRYLLHRARATVRAALEDRLAAAG